MSSRFESCCSLPKLSFIQFNTLRARFSLLDFAFWFAPLMCSSGYSPGCLWAPYVRYAFDSFNREITHLSLEFFESRIGPYLPHPSQMQIPANTGRLCATCSGDGKCRLFGVGNYINQRLLYPMHQWLASVLSSIPMDGTFNQTAPLDRLRGIDGTVYSLDLKSATDRWPLLLLFELVQCLFDRSFASSVVNSTLGTNVFDIAFVRKHRNICFVTGQPLGYYSSWPLFALSHHVLVWYAAEQCYPGQVFRRYAILGDDIVIADDRVAMTYSALLERLGVSISLPKSLTSKEGACEFAKRFRLKRMTVDVSPLSIRKLASVRNPLGWYNFMLSTPVQLRLSTQLRLAGFGFKASSRPASNHGKRCRRLLIMRYYGMLPCTLWLAVAVGYVPRPEVLGRVIDRLREHFVPKDPITPPDVVFPYPGMRDFLEWSLYQGWMRQYLAYLQWYCAVALDPCVSVDKSTPNRLYSFSAPCFFAVGVDPGSVLDARCLGFLRTTIQGPNSSPIGTSICLPFFAAG